MATYGENNGPVATSEPYNSKITKTKTDGKHEGKRVKDLRQTARSLKSNTDSVASFTTNTNTVVCLPLVSEELKLVWTQSDQTRELDNIPELVQAFNLFPYPTAQEVSTLARVCTLPLDKVKVWFMVQRIKYGISWSSEEIQETRQKLSVDKPCKETSDEDMAESKNESSDELMIEEDDSEAEDSVSSASSQKAKAKCDSPDSNKSAKTNSPCFSSSLPPPQDSYFYRPPADTPPTTIVDIPAVQTESPIQQSRNGRYKKSKAQLAALRKSFLVEHWPAELELRRLQEETGLSRNDIRKWFSDSRYQLRVGRGTIASSQNYSYPQSGTKPEESQTVPSAQKTPQVNGGKGQDRPRSNGAKNADFFQTFLTNTLEAFGEKAPDADDYDEAEDLSGDGDSVKDDEQIEEQPLQLTKTCKGDPDVPLDLKNSPRSSHSGTPPPTTGPHKQTLGSSTSKKSIKASPNPHSGASASTLTPGGRPRKTKEQLSMLKDYFLRCQWPKSEEYTELVKVTGLPRADIIQWFGDTRYAVKNGQLRWVKGVREQFLAELAAQQNSGGITNGSGSSQGGSRKRKSTTSDSPNLQPLVSYFFSTGSLNEKDLDTLCKKSRMSYQQVRDWFASQVTEETDPEINVAD
ncbi:homeobox and leucine zipper encoding a [Synchiropus picturatus]